MQLSPRRCKAIELVPLASSRVSSASRPPPPPPLLLLLLLPHPLLLLPPLLLSLPLVHPPPLVLFSLHLFPLHFLLSPPLLLRHHPHLYFHRHLLRHLRLLLLHHPPPPLLLQPLHRRHPLRLPFSSCSFLESSSSLFA